MTFQKFPNFKMFQGQVLLGIDYGSKVIGLATFCPGSDPYPLPFGRIIQKKDHSPMAELLTHINCEAVEIVVLGLPRYEDGNDSTQTKKVRAFAQEFKAACPLALYFQDETLSTYEAQERMKSSPRYNFQVDPKQIDALSAAILLEDFIRGPAPMKA